MIPTPAPREYAPPPENKFLGGFALPPWHDLTLGQGGFVGEAVQAPMGRPSETRGTNPRA
jgi:hypothetical protein